MRETSSLRWDLSARRKLWVTFLLSEFRFCSRSKHAGENQRFGLCGHDKRGPVVPRDLGLPVQDERLSEHGFGGGRGERLDARRTRARTHTFLCCLPVRAPISITRHIADTQRT